MIKNVVDIDWRDPVICASSFLTIFMMGLTGSITNGIALGVFAYTAGALLTGRKKEVSSVMYVLAAVFLIHFVLIYGVIPSGWNRPPEFAPAMLCVRGSFAGHAAGRSIEGLAC